MIIRDANLNDWDDLKALSRKIQAGNEPCFENARKFIDVTEETLQVYLAQSLAIPHFHFWIVRDESGIVAFMFLTVAPKPDIKRPTHEMVLSAFVVLAYSHKKAASMLTLTKMKAFAGSLGIKYYYGHSSKKGACDHFINEYGFEEIHRTVYLGTEKIK